MDLRPDSNPEAPHDTIVEETAPVEEEMLNIADLEEQILKDDNTSKESVNNNAESDALEAQNNDQKTIVQDDR